MQVFFFCYKDTVLSLLCVSKLSIKFSTLKIDKIEY